MRNVHLKIANNTLQILCTLPSITPVVQDRTR